MERRFQTFTVLVSKINRSIKRIKAEEMAEFRLKGPHVSCLYYLYVAGPLTAAELCDCCEEDKAAISRSLEYLEENGYLTCGDGGGKRYKALLRLTEKGQSVGRRVLEKTEAFVAGASRGLTDAERETMYQALTKISVNLDQLSQGEVQ